MRGDYISINVTVKFQLDWQRKMHVFSNLADTLGAERMPGMTPLPPLPPFTTTEWNCFHCFHCLAPRTHPIELKIEQERQHSPTRNCTKSGLDPCRFSPDMIKTSFTLFFLTKTTYKSHFQRRKACDSIRPHLPSIPSHFLESLSYKILKYRHCLPVPLIFRTVNFFFLPLWPAGGPVAPQ